jgi:hypothetical protein
MIARALRAWFAGGFTGRAPGPLTWQLTPHHDSGSTAVADHFQSLAVAVRLNQLLKAEGLQER